MTIPESLYYAGYLLKKRLSLIRRRRLPHPVISIGNLTLGGTGKTPAAIALAEEALKRGLFPIILTRGYRGKAKGPCQVDASQINGAAWFGDEPLLMASRLTGVPVIKCADRYLGGLFALRLKQVSGLSAETPVVFILDDGFQHWKLYRDFDIVLIDGTDPFGNRKLLPLGRLRGPLSELCEAGALVITKKPDPGLTAELIELNPKAAVLNARHRVTGIITSGGIDCGIEFLRGKRVLGFCGTAKPEQFKNTLLELGVQPVAFRAFGDHHRYTGSDLSALIEMCSAEGCDLLVTTEKDIVKIRAIPICHELYFVRIGFTADPGLYDLAFSHVLQPQYDDVPKRHEH